MIQVYKDQLKTFMDESSSTDVEKYSYNFQHIAIGKNKKTKIAIECFITMEYMSEKTYARIVCSEDKNWYLSCGYETFQIIENKSKYFVDNAHLISETKYMNHKSCLIHNKYKKNFDRRTYIKKEYPGGVLCSHIKNMLSVLPNDILDELEQIIDDIVAPNEYHEDIAKVDNIVYKYTKPIKKEKNTLLSQLNNYSFKGESIMVLGHAGYGKTYSVKEFAEQNNYIFCELQGHQQIETIDMFGYLMEAPSKQKVWFDGPVSKAARLASDGNKVVLFIDEFLNIPMRETAGLKAALEPYKGHYYFQTNRMINYDDGIGESEIIKVPIKNLQIIVASNVGNGYLVEELDKALIQRFLIINHTVDIKHIQSILDKQCADKSFDSSISMKLVSFYKSMKKHYEKDMIKSYPSLRHLSRKLLDLIEDEDMLFDITKAQKFQWIDYDSDGNPDSIQESIVDATIENSFG